LAPTISSVFKSIRNAIQGEKARQDFLKDAANMGVKRLEDYKRFEDYYCGEHRVQLNDREREYLEASGFRYAENFCETIVDTHASRMAVSGFGAASGDDALAKFALDLWSENDLDAGQTQVHEGLVKLGDFFVIVEPEEGRLPCVTPLTPSQGKAVYDSGEMIYFVKVWNTVRFSASNPQGRKIRRMNIYWPDRIDKWFCPDSEGDTWGAYKDREDEEGNSKEWTMDGEPDGDPIGIPVIHFANKPSPFYGRSVLRGVIPQQDSLNKSLIDFYWVMDAQGWPQQWGTGTTADGVKRHPGSLWTSESAEARFGQLDPADPEKSIKAIESQITRMASRSETPLHLMLAGGNLPSGETLKTSESGLTRATKNRQIANGPGWRNTVKIAARIEKAFGESDPTDEGKLATRWERAESRQELDEANTAVLWSGLGVSRDTILSRLGFDPEDEQKKRDAEEPLVGADDLLIKAQQMQQSEAVPQGTGGEQPREGKTTQASGRTR